MSGGGAGGSMSRDSQPTTDQAPGAQKGAPGAQKGAQERTSPAQKSTQQDGQPGAQPRQQTQSPTQPRQTESPQPGGAKQGAQTGDTKGQGTAQGQGKGQTKGAMATSNVSLTSEQKTTIRNTVITSGPKVTSVNFDIKVGIAVPRTVKVAPVPAMLIEIQPAWRGYMYFVYADEIIIVEPRTLRIVAVLEV
jgi:hypothetical protein